MNLRDSTGQMGVGELSPWLLPQWASGNEALTFLGPRLADHAPPPNSARSPDSSSAGVPGGTLGLHRERAREVFWQVQLPVPLFQELYLMVLAPPMYWCSVF